MDGQEDITARMRAILIDWLVEVHLKFKLAPSTLYLCVHLIDQYCTHNQVQRSKLQLVGITALLIACKYEEIYPPEVRRRGAHTPLCNVSRPVCERMHNSVTLGTPPPIHLPARVGTGLRVHNGSRIHARRGARDGDHDA